MTTEQPKYISLSSIKEILVSNDNKQSEQAFIGKGFVMMVSKSQSMLPFLGNNIPFRIDEMRWGYASCGYADVFINLQPYHITAGMMVFIGSDSILQINKVSEDFNFMGFTVTIDLLNGLMHGQIPTTMQIKMTQFCFETKPDERLFFLQLFDTLWNAVHLTGEKNDVTASLICAMVRYYETLYLKHSQEESKLLSRERMIFQQFIQLVNHTNGTQRQISYYAEQMNLTQRYLGTIIKQVSNTTAKEWIDRSTIIRIKVLLRHSELQITQISNQLHFANDSFFNKYFKRLTGLTPNEYRHEK